MSISLKFNHKDIDDANPFKQNPYNAEELSRISRLSGVTEIEFSEGFDQELSGLKHIKSIKISSSMFNKRIRDCPDLENLFLMAYNFNEFIDFTNLKKLERLELYSSEYSLETLLDFRHTRLKYIKIEAWRFNAKLLLPGTVETLSINSDSYTHPFDNLPLSLKELTLHIGHSYEHSFDYLPHGLLKFKLFIKEVSLYRHPIPVTEMPKPLYSKTLGNIPSSVIDLGLVDYFGDLNQIPDSVETLTLEYVNDMNHKVFTAIAKLFDNIYKLPKNLQNFNYQPDLYIARMKTNAFARAPGLDMVAVLRSKVDLSNITINGIKPIRQ